MDYTESEIAYIAVNAAFASDGIKYKALSFFSDDPVSLIKNYEKLKPLMINSGKEGLYNSIKEFFSDGESVKKELYKLNRRGEECVTIASPLYPAGLCGMQNPPLVLYARGNVQLLAEEKFAVVGSRRTPPNILSLTQKFARSLSEHFAVVTGIADGGDSAALSGALENKRAICVLPSGHGVITPSSSYRLYEEAVKNGLVISAFQYNEGAKKYSFVERNALIAQLSRGVLVVSAGEKSGALSTANEAVNAGKDVFAFPYGVGVSCGVGCNRLIKDGAYLCDDVNDVLSFYGKSLKKESAEEDLSDGERAIASALAESEGGLHLTEIAKITGFDMATLLNDLTTLEIKGKIIRLGGNRYSAV